MTRVSKSEYKSALLKATERRRRREENAKFIRKMGATVERQSLADLIIECDDMTSHLIRKTDAILTGGWCRFNSYRKCGGKIECAFHFFRKSRSLYLRFHRINIVASCFKCNGDFENDETPFWYWYKDYYGSQEYEEVKLLSHRIVGNPREFLEAKKAELKKALEKA